MDTIDRSNSNLPAHFHVPLPSHARLTPALPADQGTAPAVQINPKVILRGLTRHWWRILLLWLVVSVPIALLIWLFIPATYEVSSLLRIEAAQPDIFGALRERENDSENTSLTYLQTQVSLIKSAKVLTPAVASPGVANLPTIKKSDDPKSDLREDLVVEIVKNANLIRVSLESPNAQEAVTIVNAVVDSYLAQNNDYSRNANRALSDSLEARIKKLGAEIEQKKKQLKDLIKQGRVTVLKPQDMLNTSTKNETDSNQPTVKTLSANQIEQMIHEIVRNDLELSDAQSLLEVKLAADETNQQATEQLSPDDQELEARIREEFNKAPDVQALVNEIHEVRDHIEHTKGVARQSSDPAMREAQKRCDKMENQHKLLWEQKYEEIRGRLTATAATAGAASGDSVNELKFKVDRLIKKKEKLAALFKEMQVDQKISNDDTFEATFLNHEIATRMNWQEQAQKNLEQLSFEAHQDKYRVVLVDAAAPPLTPSNNKRLKFLAAAPVGVMFMMLGLFLLLEIKAERVADPDALSTRVRSEVYALPPLPTARSIRKLSESDANDQIEQFVQRLDHLRFAVCDKPAELGKGRCVIITSAIGGEGKTTLAAQLAARCGNAGMSTLLIDSDFRRASLCPLLDVPEGPGLSDVLKDEATIDEVTIPVQGGAFYLLPAGTIARDTSRLLQGPKFGQLMSQLRQLYDLIIIDSPPVLPVPDALIMGRWTDGAVIACAV